MASFKLFWWNTREEIQIQSTVGESAWEAVKRHCRIPLMSAFGDDNTQPVYLRKQTCDVLNIDQFLMTPGGVGFSKEIANDGEDVVMRSSTHFHESRKGLGTVISDEKQWGRGGPYDMRVYKEGGPMSTQTRNSDKDWDKTSYFDATPEDKGLIAYTSEEQTLKMANLRRDPVTDPCDPPKEPHY